MASNTRARGASKRRERRISSGEGVVTSKVSLFAARLPTMTLLLCLQSLQIAVEPIEPPLPELAVALGPVHDLLERCRLQPAVTPLRLAPPGDQASALQHRQVLRHR